MKKYLLLPFAAALMVSPALAQSSTNNDNLKPHEDVIKGAEDSAKPNASGAAIGSGKSSTSNSTNSSNLKDESSTVKGAEESATKKLPAGSTSGGGAADSSGSSTNSGNLKP